VETSMADDLGNDQVKQRAGPCGDRPSKSVRIPPGSPSPPNPELPGSSLLRRLARLREEGLAAILPSPTTGAPGLTRAGVLPQWHLADPFGSGVLRWRTSRSGRVCSALG
jgi:hypothetical protein